VRAIQIGGKHQRGRAGLSGIELRDKTVILALRSPRARLGEGSRGGWERRGLRTAADEDIPGAYGQRPAKSLAGGVGEKRGIHQGMSIRSQLGDERRPGVCLRIGLKGGCGWWGSYTVRSPRAFPPDWCKPTPET